MLAAAIADRLNLIVRPYGPGVTFIQLDDLTADKRGAAPLAPAMLGEARPGERVSK